jgi:hypothetical protein
MNKWKYELQSALYKRLTVAESPLLSVHFADIKDGAQWGYIQRDDHGAVICVAAGYASDGATCAPDAWPPWCEGLDMRLKDAVFVHDLLCQALNTPSFRALYTRKQADQTFTRLMREHRFPPWRLYSLGVTLHRPFVRYVEPSLTIIEQ